jgi:uncharacterized RDD family membrane protein YckC
MARALSGRNVVMGLVVRTGRVGATTGRAVLFPARLVTRSRVVEPFRGRAESLAETGRSAEVGARRRLESAAAEVLAAPEAEQVVDGVLAGPLPEAITRSLIEHRVVERAIAEAFASGDLERELASAAETERIERLVAQVLASPALERLLADALESRLTLEFTERLLGSPPFKEMLKTVLSSAEVREAIKGQSRSLAQDVITDVRHKVVRLDAAAERSPRRWFHRPPRPRSAPGEPLAVRFGGIATRGVALAVDAALIAVLFLTGIAVLGLVVSLLWKPRPASLVGGVIAGAAVLFEIAYFTGFWATAGQTPGMRLMHLRVVDASGSAPSVGRSFVRLVGLFLSILLLLTGFLPVLVDDRRRALQDFLATTTILYHDASLPPDGDASETNALPAEITPAG